MMAVDICDSEWRTFTRIESKYTNESERFVLPHRNFQRQYAHIYAARLWALRPKLQAAAESHWGSGVPVCRLSELQLDQDCIIIGTLYKQMELKPSILKEISEQNGLVAPPGVGSRSRYSDPSDELILEDELQRVALTGDIDVGQMISGTVVALYGHQPEEFAGKFFVKGIAYSYMPSQVPRPVSEPEKFVLFVSGLEIGRLDDTPFHRQLLIDLITGQLGDESLQEMMSKITRVVIAGNSLSDQTRDREAATRAKYLSKKTEAGTKDAVAALDDFLLQLAAGVEVDLMPGEFDPSSFALPQQPMHHCMLPRAAPLTTMHCVTNPYDFSVDGVRVLGSSGQLVGDVVRFTSGLDDHLDVLEKTFIAGHLAPTAPDTLGCYPYAGEDPFIIEICPHIMFTGNAPSFSSRMFCGQDNQTVLLLAIPRFSESSTCILVNLNTLECQPFVVESEIVPQNTVTNHVEKMDESL